MDALTPTPSTVIAAYAHSFIEGRKVVVFGDCTSGLAEQLVERGARLVHVYDHDLTRVAEAAARGSAANIAYAPLGQSGIAVRDGAFDVGVVENLAAADDAPALMKRLRRALAARGVSFVMSPNPDVEPVLLEPSDPVKVPPSYYELYEIVSKEFDEVRMVGQTPFVGYALADFTPGAAEEFSIDTTFVPGGAEEPEWFLAVASHFPVTIEPFNFIQLPAASLLAELKPDVDPAPLEEAQKRIAQLEQRLAKAEKEQASSADRELLVRAKAELEKRDAWVAEVEARAAAADERADSAEDRADAAEERANQASARLTEASAKLTELEAKLAASNQRAKELESRLAEADKRQREAQLRLAAAADELRAREPERGRDAEATERKLERLEAKLTEQKERLEEKDARLRVAREEQAAYQADIERAEAQLRERASSLIELRRDLARLEALSAQLLADLEEARERLGRPQMPAPAVEPHAGVDTARFAELEANLDELARVDARRVADLTAAQWTVQELEGKLVAQEELSRAELEQLRAELSEKVTLLLQLQNAPPN